MAFRCLAEGVRAARREWRLVVLLWIVGLLFAAIATLPVVGWWHGLVAYAPEADQMLRGVNVAVLGDLLGGQHADGWQVLGAAVLSMALAARVAHAFVIGGVIEVLAGHRRVAAATVAVPAPAGQTVAASAVPDVREPAVAPERSELSRRPLALSAGLAPSGASRDAGDPAVAVALLDECDAEPASGGIARTSDDRLAGTTAAAPPPGGAPTILRFFAGGGRSFLRNLVLLLLSSSAAAIAAVMLFRLGRVAASPLHDTLAEPLAWTRVLLPALLGSVGVFFFTAVFDYAAIRVATADRRPLRAWWASIRFVASHLPSVATLWLGPGLLLAGAAALYLGFRAAVPATTALLITATVLVQQLLTVTRAGLRVTTLAAEAEYAAARGLIALAPPPSPTYTREAAAHGPLPVG